MQVTIPQVEIELAIQNYIRSIIALQPGTDMKVDLKATRGPEGTTAVIDITSGQAQTNVAQVQAAQEPEAKTASKSGPVTAKADKEVVAQDPKVQQNPVVHADEGQFNTAGDTTDVVETPAAADDAAEVPAEKPRSLFGNLGKPKNA